MTTKSRLCLASKRRREQRIRENTVGNRMKLAVCEDMYCAVEGQHVIGCPGCSMYGKRNPGDSGSTQLTGKAQISDDTDIENDVGCQQPLSHHGQEQGGDPRPLSCDTDRGGPAPQPSSQSGQSGAGLKLVGRLCSSNAAKRSDGASGEAGENSDRASSARKHEPSQAEGGCRCPVCGCSLEQLAANDRQIHVNACCDEGGAGSTAQPRAPSQTGRRPRGRQKASDLNLALALSSSLQEGHNLDLFNCWVDPLSLHKRPGKKVRKDRSVPQAARHPSESEVFLQLLAMRPGPQHDNGHLRVTKSELGRAAPSPLWEMTALSLPGDICDAWEFISARKCA